MENPPARARQLAKPYRVAKGQCFRLRDIDPVDALAELDLHYPKVSAEQRRALAAARRELTRG